MRLFLALTALLALAPSAHAGRVAVFYDAIYGRSRNPSHGVTETIMNRNGLAFDRFNAGERTWGESGKADSTWFRERYDAIVIPFLDGGESGSQLFFSWGTTFLNAAGATGIPNSPLSGRWGIPVYVLGLGGLSGATAGTDETANAWVPGGMRAPLMFAIPSLANRGTWGYKMLCRFRGSNQDTIYTNAANMACLRGTWPGNGTISAIVWADSALGGAGCTAGDTIVSVWRFRPLSGKPGITYSILPIERLGSIDGVLFALQNIYASTPAKPQRRITIPIEPHNTYAGTTNRTLGVQHVRAIHDTLAAYGIRMTLGLPQTSSLDYAIQHDADTRAELRRVVGMGNKWQPGSNGGLGGFGFYAAADTTAIRVGFNSLMNTAARADSFGLPGTMMERRRYVPPSGVCGAWAAKVLVDAGYKTVVSTLSTPAENWSLLVGSGPTDPPVRFPIPGASETRSINVAGTIVWNDGATFAAVRGSAPETDWVGGQVTMRIGWAAQTHSSLYWHVSTNTTGADGYWRWFASVIGRHFRFFDRVLAPA